MAAINLNSLKSEIRLAVINDKANACPMVARLAWHASGTYDKNDGTGGSDGATMRFDPEDSEDANKVRHPELSYADLWVVAGCMAIEFLGGPAVPFNLGRTDAPDGSHCPAIGRLPDANQGAQHLRDVFYRMGFNDREIVALSGAHTLGRCHLQRSGFDGPWTHNPLRFDNAYFRNLVNLTWVPRKWDGPLQYQDKETGKLMMLPTDLALIEDRGFRPVVEEYARDQATFFKDFAAAFAKLLSLGCPAHCQPDHTPVDKSTDKDRKSSEFRELCMHGSLEPARNLAPHCDVGASEPGTGRTAVHKAAFWGHVDVTKLLVELRAPLDAKDSSGDTALHDAARFGHAECVSILLSAGANPRVRNNEGLDVVALAMEYKKPKVVAILKAHRSKL